MRILRTLLFMPLALLMTGALAGSYPDKFRHAGTVDRIDLRNRTIVVSDMLWQITDYVQVRDGSGKLMDLRRLRLGMEVGLITQSAAQGDAIVELWVLPKGYLASERNKYRY